MVRSCGSDCLQRSRASFPFCLAAIVAERSTRRKNEFTIAEKARLINYAGRNSSCNKNDLGKGLADQINSQNGKDAPQARLSAATGKDHGHRRLNASTYVGNT